MKPKPGNKKKVKGGTNWFHLFLWLFDIICAIRYNRHVDAPVTGHFHIKKCRYAIHTDLKIEESG
ncbi:MAG: hypothetical protein D8M54_06785 [Chloroflexi bacterium]|nr:hypothetical protein [Chloroflexota bacterium]